jgi:type IV pilus assembly protein PilM
MNKEIFFKILKFPRVSKFNEKFLHEQLSFGLDIGASQLKFVKLKTGKSTRLEDFAVLDAGADLSESLKKISEKCANKPVNISVSGNSVVIRYAMFPKMDRSELKQALKFEAQKHIPFSVADVELDAFILKDDFPDNRMLVLLAAVKKDYIAAKLKVLADAGIKVALVDVDSVALTNAFNFNYPFDPAQKHKTIAVVNIGTSASNLNVIEDGIPRLSRDIHVSGNNLTKKMVDMYNIEPQEAEEIKKSQDSEKLAKYSRAIESVVGDMASELRISFDYYESQSVSSVSSIFLSGGSSKVCGLREILSSTLGIETQYWNPFEKINSVENIDAQKLSGFSSELAVAVGLALRGRI